MPSLGLDIGGANTKALLIEEGNVKKHWLDHIPLWKRKEDLGNFLDKLSETEQPESVGITMTGELSDIFEHKKRGVSEIIETVSEKFEDEVCYFMSLEGDLLSKEEALDSPRSIGGANWVASGLIVSEKQPNCLLVDVGSTTTDLIPIQDGTPAPLGRTDFQRLKADELVYAGVLRTPIPYLCSKIDVDGTEIGIASEYFAIMADVYRILGMIEKEDYTCETPDGRGREKEDCMRRMARIFCSDRGELGEDFISKAAERLYENQVELLENAFKKVAGSCGLSESTKVIVTGIGRKILAEKAAKAAKFDRIDDLADEYGKKAALMTPAFGMGLLAEEAFRNEHGS